MTTSWYLKGEAIGQLDRIEAAWDAILDGVVPVHPDE